MSRGGKREGAGRRGSGYETRKVSLSLSPEMWKMMEKTLQENEWTLGSYLRDLVVVDLIPMEFEEADEHDLI